MTESSISLLPPRAASLDNATASSAELADPALPTQEVTLGFAALTVTHRDGGSPSLNLVTVMDARSWRERVAVCANSNAIDSVDESFDGAVESRAWKSRFPTRIEPA